MENSKLDFIYFQPEVFQAIAGNDFIVYAYMNDGSIRVLDMKPMIKKGGVFKILEDEKIFREKITVLNNSVAWDIDGNRDEYKCIDIDPFHIFNCPMVIDIPEDTPLPDELEAIVEEKADTDLIIPHEAINRD